MEESIKDLDSSSGLNAANRFRSKALYYLKYFGVGVALGIILTKSEVVSWYRIQEMFRLQSFHVYGVIGTAIFVSGVGVWLIKKLKIKTAEGETVIINPKRFHQGQIWGGLLFGLGWAMTGACPGTLFVQLGSGVLFVSATFLSSIAGTWVYGYVRERLPH